VKQFDPPQTVLLGQPVYWIVEARHPLWESYDLSLQPPAGVQMEVASRTDRRAGNEMETLYRVRIVPQELAMATPPAAVLSGTGGAVVLATKRMEVRAISGASLEMRAPETPRFRQEASRAATIAGAVVVALLLCAFAYLQWKRRWEARPRQVLLRELRELQRRARIRRPADPAWLCSLFRSELLWGAPVEASTVSELQERSRESPPLAAISHALESFEHARYSGALIRDQALVTQSVSAAMEVLGVK
jgi:hypothetical protein